jgi:hypothetical protein
MTIKIPIYLTQLHTWHFLSLDWIITLQQSIWRTITFTVFNSLRQTPTSIQSSRPVFWRPASLQSDDRGRQGFQNVALLFQIDTTVQLRIIFIMFSWHENLNSYMMSMVRQCASYLFSGTFCASSYMWSATVYFINSPISVSWSKNYSTEISFAFASTTLSLLKTKWRKYAKPSYNNISLYNTLSIASDILWYQLIPHC